MTFGILIPLTRDFFAVLLVMVGMLAALFLLGMRMETLPFDTRIAVNIGLFLIVLPFVLTLWNRRTLRRTGRRAVTYRVYRLFLGFVALAPLLFAGLAYGIGMFDDPLIAPGDMADARASGLPDWALDLAGSASRGQLLLVTAVYYGLPYLYMRLRGGVDASAALRLHAQADREAQIDIQTEAILRAERIKREQGL